MAKNYSKKVLEKGLLKFKNSEALEEMQSWRPLISRQKTAVKTHIDVIVFVLGQWKCKGLDNLSWSILILFYMILCWGVKEE